MRERRMLVTGASGFLGSVLGRLAVERGYAVSGTYLDSAIPESTGIEPFRVDLREPERVREVVLEAEPGIVIHTAYAPADRQVIYGGTSSLLRACSELEREPVFVHISTDLVFDGRKGAYTERDVPEPVMPYGRHKLDAERVVMERFPGALIVRSSLFYDLERLPSHLDFAVEALKYRRPCRFFRDEYRSPVLVDDLADAVLLLAGKGCSGLYHVGGADRVDRWWFGTCLMRALGLSLEYVEPGSIRMSASPRPRDCSLVSSKAEDALGKAFRGAKEVLREFEQEG